MTVQLLIDAIDVAAHKDDQNAAFVHLNDSLTYGQLARSSSRLANILQELGVKKGDRVGIYRKIGLESVVALYGIMKAGAAYVPLDPALPVRRLTDQLQNCGIKVLVSDTRLVPKIEKAMFQGAPVRAVIGIDAIENAQAVGWDEVENAPDQFRDVGLTGEDLSYIIYTSGSTGVPKGIVHTHSSALAYATRSAATYELRKGDRVANHAPLHFDISTFGMFSVPQAEATTVLIPEAFKAFPAEISKLIENQRLTHWYSAPFALTQMISHGALDTRDLSSVRWVMFGGDLITAEEIQQLFRVFPAATFSNVFGPAEVNEISNHIFTKPPKDGPIPVGKYCDNVEPIILSDDDQPVPTGDVGELVVKTPTRMKGYWNLPQLTKSVTLEHMSPEGKTDYFHRTGDLVQMGKDGLLYFLGRKDRQVKVRGYRLALEEIELALMSHPAVEEVGVIVDRGGETLSGAVTLRNPVEVGDLVQFCREILPPYAIPRRVVVLDDLPRTTSGKVSRPQLSKLLEV